MQSLQIMGVGLALTLIEIKQPPPPKTTTKWLFNADNHINS